MIGHRGAAASNPLRELCLGEAALIDQPAIGVGQLELANVDQVAEIREDLLKAMAEVKADGRHSVLLMLTDVVKEGTDLVVLSDDPALIEKAFNSKLQGTSMWIDGMMSRKKQTIPNLQKAFGC